MAWNYGLYVHKDNKVAIRAYEKVGFVISNYDVMILKSTLTNRSTGLAEARR
jgi:ribosomal protein S18 acetylase RimI-like enzyme